GLYRRYCDDLFFVVFPGQIENIRKMVVESLQSLALRINVPKTETFLSRRTQDGTVSIVRLDESENERPCNGVQYLGFVFDGKEIRLRDSTLARYQRKVKEAIRKAVYMIAKRKRAREKLVSSGAAVYISREEYKRFRRSLLRRFVIPRFGGNAKNRNFANYAQTAAEIMNGDPKSSKIRRQCRNIVKIIDCKLAAEMQKNGLTLRD
ncbi:MAG: hypothetical protein NZ534_02545, partial [Bacteroidia bacterium]|nr:hypothetical protein [Bacteroidia bacterium]